MTIKNKKEVLQQQTEKTFLTLLDIVYIDRTGKERSMHYVDDYFSIISNDVVYDPAAFKADFGGDNEDGVPDVTISFDTGDLSVVRFLDEQDVTPKIRMSVIASDTPDIVEIGPVEYEIKDYSVEGTSVSLSLAAEPLLEEPIPGIRFTPLSTPGLFT